MINFFTYKIENIRGKKKNYATVYFSIGSGNAL